MDEVRGHLEYEHVIAIFLLFYDLYPVDVLLGFLVYEGKVLLRVLALVSLEQFFAFTVEDGYAIFLLLQAETTVKAVERCEASCLEIRLFDG